MELTSTRSKPLFKRVKKAKEQQRKEATNNNKKSALFKQRAVFSFSGCPAAKYKLEESEAKTTHALHIIEKKKRQRRQGIKDQKGGRGKNVTDCLIGERERKDTKQGREKKNNSNKKENLQSQRSVENKKTRKKIERLLLLYRIDQGENTHITMGAEPP